MTGHKQQKRIIDEFSRNASFLWADITTMSRYSMINSALYTSVTKRHYCTPKEDKKSENEEEKKETADSERPSSPFAQRAASSDDKQEETHREVPPPPNPPKAEPKKLTPALIIPINTEKQTIRRVMRGFGLTSFNFMVAARTWKSMPDGSPISDYWQRMIHRSRYDAFLMFLGAFAVSGPDLSMLILWIAGVLWFPDQLLPQTFKTPSRQEVRDFVYAHLQAFDEHHDGTAPVHRAKAVLHIVEREITPDVVDAVLAAAGADEFNVNYKKLADVIVGNNDSD